MNLHSSCSSLKTNLHFHSILHSAAFSEIHIMVVSLPRNEEAKLLPRSSSGEFAEFPEVVAIESQNTIAKPGSISGGLL